MDYIKGVTFGAFAGKESFKRKKTYESLDLLIERTGANLVTLVPNGLQDTAQSQEIDFTSPATYSDEELIDMINYIHSRGLMVALKPTVNCKNGTWRAHISFFEKDVPCEPKWSVWFEAYKNFQQHYAKIAEATKCEIFIAGCEMVQAEHREKEWRDIIASIRNIYHGLLTYNTDKYQEDNVTWWDCVDYICSSGYYPIKDWDKELNRIEKVVKKFNKPFFFAEIGCMSTSGSMNIPNDWSLQGEPAPEEQAEWYKTMINECNKRSFVKGFVIWDWSINLYNEKDALTDKGYGIFGKPSEKVIREAFH